MTRQWWGLLFIPKKGEKPIWIAATPEECKALDERMARAVKVVYPR